MIGQKLGSFRIESKLGSGAMGVVYKAIHETTGRAAAVKVVTSELTQKGTAYERFKREADILQQFRHPNIVRFLAVGRSQGTSYFAMEYVPGDTLEALLERRGFLPWQEVLHLAIQSCDALHYAHQHGVVHRDLKPSNLMVSEKGQVKLTDFGIAKDLDATALTATGRTLGTAAYMAPEQIRGTPEVSHKTDLYALGVLLYQLLTGEVPYDGPTAVVLMHKHLTEPVPRPSSKVHEIPKALDDLVVKLMAKEPADRPWDAAAAGMVLTDLRDRQLRGEPLAMVWPTMTTEGTRTSASTRPRKPKSKKKAAAGRLDASWLQTGLLGLALVGLLGVVAYLLWPPSDEYLYRKAEAMMASTDPTDWFQAEKEYLAELNDRYKDRPDRHPYRKQAQAWRDRILLHRAVRRAGILDKPVLGGVSRGDTDAERLYRSVSTEAVEDEKAYRDLDAARRWREMAAALQQQSPDERGWILLAGQRAEALEKKVRDRHEQVVEELKRSQAAAEAGRLPESIQIRQVVVDRYGRYPELAALIDQVKASLAPAPPATQAPPDERSSTAPTPTERDQPATPAQPVGTPEATSPKPDDR